MVKRGLIQRSVHAAALLAVALFSFAYAQSSVMQASGPAAGTTMTMCTRVGLAHVNANHGAPAEKSPKICPFCAAPAHAPVCGSVAPIPRSSVVGWTAYAALQPLGPRGPPAFTANARGPPATILTI